ncbi:arylsulfotransferase family protein [Thiohalorhabdus denitrificans]|uniref:Arylsulfotransferase (ASST) n=1 Tax=Thiohalorhabdus denitrificans TaxID=381306 RepID=A0A1G5ATS8_9GAMM|nr:arylsulfotransferase family protein [Thiohalorhabdus denitrificans]SCX81305.1 Arylsulfotransferase (ASST) [Thiohalorhabdus denitrificans]
MDANKVFFGLFLSSLVFLAFVGGSLATVAEVFPAEYIRNAYRAANAFALKSTSQGSPYWSDLWMPTRTSKQGVVAHDPDRARQGLTLFTSGHGPKAYLLDMDGEVVHSWERPFSEVWDDTSTVADPVPDSHTYFRKARVFPDGDLLAIYIGVGDTPWGYGMVRLDRDARVIWKNLDRFHHDFAVAEDGRIFGLTHAFRREKLEEVDHIKPPFLEDSLAVLSPEGETTKKISLVEAFNASEEYRRLLWRIPYYSLEDPLHTNGVDYLDEEAAERLSRKVPEAAEGQVLLSFRELAGGALALLDPETEEVVWALRGPWLSQHDPDILPNGNLLLFDNRGHFGPGDRSRIAEVDPSTGGVVWAFSGDEERPLESRIRGAQQPLDNGNILITESNGGRLLEITPDGEVVWEYVNPRRAMDEDGKSFTPVVSWGQRVTPEYLSSGFRDQFGDKRLVKGQGLQ